jgi:hypothetical protein
MTEKKFLVGYADNSTVEVAIPYGDINGMETVIDEDRLGGAVVAVKVSFFTGYIREETKVVTLRGGYWRDWDGLHTWIKEHTL